MFLRLLRSRYLSDVRITTLQPFRRPRWMPSAPRMVVRIPSKANNPKNIRPIMPTPPAYGRAGVQTQGRQRVLIRNVRHSPPATLNLDRTSRVTIAADNDSAIEFRSDVIRRAVAARAVATLVGLDVGTLSLFLTDALRAAGSGERGLVLAAKGPMRGETCPGSTHPAPRTSILEM